VNREKLRLNLVGFNSDPSCSLLFIASFSCLFKSNSCVSTLTPLLWGWSLGMRNKRSMEMDGIEGETPVWFVFSPKQGVKTNYFLNKQENT